MAAPEELAPLTGAAKILGTVSLALATFMNVLDTSIANVSLSSIGGDLGVSTTQVTWVITSFGVANAIAVPLTGWLSQRFGAVRLFTASIVLFSIASLLCGLSRSLQELIVFRVLQGAVAGPMIPLSQALLLSRQAGGLSSAQAGAAIDRSIEVESHLLAANDLFWISSILFLAMIGVIWLARPVKANLAPGIAGGAH
jgi:MFS family permease